MSTVIIKRNVRRALEDKEAEKKRASADGGSCYRQLVGKFLRTILSVSAPFQKTHGIDGCDHVVVKFNTKTKVMSLAFHKNEVPGVSRKISRSGKGKTAYLQVASIFNAVGLELTRNLYRADFAVNPKNGDILIDFSGTPEMPHLEPKKKDAVVTRRRDRDNRSFVPFNEKEAKKSEREKAMILEKAAEEGMLIRKA